jgi:hypothetical protein
MWRCLAEPNANVFHRMMRVNVQVAFRFDGQVDKAMAGEQRQHVIEKADASVDLRFTGAVEVERQLDFGFAGFAVNPGGSRGGCFCRTGRRCGCGFHLYLYPR